MEDARSNPINNRLASSETLVLHRAESVTTIARSPASVARSGISLCRVFRLINGTTAGFGAILSISHTAPSLPRQ